VKVYISVDIEGCAGITHWDEAEKKHADYAEFRKQMTREAVAAVEGAIAAGATDIWVKDDHDSGRRRRRHSCGCREGRSGRPQVLPAEVA
jgi:D-amino peptidase